MEDGEWREDEVEASARMEGEADAREGRLERMIRRVLVGWWERPGGVRSDGVAAWEDGRREP